jgi:hypothetical protein
MSENGPRPRWLFQYGAWIRRVLLGVAIALPLIGKACGIPDNSPTARYGFFVVVSLGAACLLVYGAEYVLAVRYRGYWFDHRFK